MADDAETLPPPSRFRRTILVAGISASSLVVVVAALVIVTIKVAKVHDIWCKRVGTFCVKEVAAAPPKPVPAGHCPDFKMSGSLTPRDPADPVWTLDADVSGRVSIGRDGASASGKSNVACFNGRFLASFSDLSNGGTTQCMGMIDGLSYAGVCSFSDTGPHDISGTFTN